MTIEYEVELKENKINKQVTSYEGRNNYLIIEIKPFYVLSINGVMFPNPKAIDHENGLYFKSKKQLKEIIINKELQIK